MDKIYVIGILVLLMIGLVSAGRCPYTGDTSPTEYSKVTVSPIERYVGKEFTITILDVYQNDDGREEPADNRLIIIYYIEGEEVVSEYNIYTNSKGVGTFTPEESGKYAIATSSKYIFFDVLSRCGDKLCTSGETRVNCPGDCSTCGDKICDVDETKENCPKDCVICGDSACDAGENRNNCPADCATCGDDVCDINENKVSCPEDCITCGDGVCDYLEITGLHTTTCPEDCAVCGDGYCDEDENTSNCQEDCGFCGDGICGAGENSTNCQDDCVINLEDNITVDTNITDAGILIICGDGECGDGEDIDICPADCVICGDNVCDDYEITSLHETTCPEDCATCGDEICDKGESETCPEDCDDGTSGLFLSYFVIPIIIAILVILFEITHYFAGAKQKLPKPRRTSTVKVPQMQHLDTAKVIPFMGVFIVSIVIASILLAGIGLSYSKNLAIFDVARDILDNGVVVSLMVVFLALGLGILSRATYYMERKQAMKLSMIATFIAFLPGLIIFMNVEYLVLMIGALMGMMTATGVAKRDASESVRKNSFKMASQFTDKVLFVTAVFVCLTVLMHLFLAEDTSSKFATSIWQSETTKSVVNDNYGIQTSEGEIEKNVVMPFFKSSPGGINGKFLFAGAVALLLLAILKIFIIIIRLLAGFFAWMFDKSGFV